MKILSLSKTLVDLSFEHQAVECNHLLKTKQKRLRGLTQLNATLDEYLVTVQGTDFAAQIVPLIEQTNDLIRAILALNQSKISVIATDMQQIKNKLKAISQGRKGIAGYYAPQYLNVAGAFTDIRR